MTRANGSFDFLSKEWVVGMALRVDRTYFGGQFASGEGVTLVCFILAYEVRVETEIPDLH